MKNFITLLLICVTISLGAQTDKPAYCDEGPATYGSVAAIPGATTAPPLPRFTTMPTKEYKIQVAILRYTDPAEYPFHPDLVARYRPCEQIWVVESRESYPNRADAVAQQNKLKDLGYGGSYITELLGYQ
jgi:hypothetical protein